VSRTTLRAHGDVIELKPGVAHGLARLAGLLKPALEIMWVDDVRRTSSSRVTIHAALSDSDSDLDRMRSEHLAVTARRMADVFKRYDPAFSYEWFWRPRAR
jgi:hypothetical protein